MQEIVLDGIVLSSQDYKESSKLLHILTNNGIILVTAKGITKQASKLKLVANPFCFAEFSLLVKNQTTLVGANIYDSFFSLSSNYNNYITGCAILDLIKKTFDDGIAIKKLFLPCVNSIKELCYSNKPALYILNQFLITYLNVCGYSLNTNTCASCGKELQEHYFNPYDASMLCQNCKHLHCQKLSTNQIKFLNQSDIELSNNELQSLTKNLANAIFCLTNIKLKIEELI